jgi:hypothetical protein
MALPQKKKAIPTNISQAVQKAAGNEPAPPEGPKTTPQNPASTGKKAGRPSPRSGNTVRLTLLLRGETEERLTMALAEEQVKRRKTGEKVDKSSLIEEMILKWLDER